MIKVKKPGTKFVEKLKKNHYCPVKMKRVRRLLRYARNDVHIHIIDIRGRGWLAAKPPTNPSP